MSDDFLDSITLIISTMIIGVVFVILGMAFESFILIFVGGIFVGGIPFLKLIFSILNR
ncbi:hypothetical protein NMT12_190034 [metagenome]